ncbi:unnamed protein product, partial [Cladocopium goreaui]
MLPEVIAKLPTSTDLITDLFSTDDVANIDERRKVFASVTLVFKFIMGTAVVRTGEGDVLNMQPHLDAYPGILGVQHRGMDPDWNVAAISCLCRGDGLASWHCNAEESVARLLSPKFKKFQASRDVLSRILTTLLRDLAHAASASAASGADHAELAEEVLRYMLRGLVAADALHCNAVLDVFQQSFQWQKALEMLNTMKVIGVPPDTASLNT